MVSFYNISEVNFLNIFKYYLPPNKNMIIDIENSSHS